jgi:hypothetical protein
MAFLRVLGSTIRNTFGFIFPMFGKKDGKRPVLRVVIHIVVLIAILVGLFFLNRYLELDRFVRAPYPLLRQLWLPLLFLLFYALCWMGWTLWRLLGPERDDSDFPEIDQAWKESLDALAEANIDPTEAPVFLVLGRAVGGEKSLFNAAGVKLQVKQAPRRGSSPITVSANQDGIYVTCGGASLLGKFAQLLASEEGIAIGSGPVIRRRSEPQSDAGEESARSQTTNDDGSDAESSSSEAAVMVADQEPDPLEPLSRPKSLLLKDTEECERITARLRHLCRMIARDRRPFCPVNGVLVLIPFQATSSDADAREAAALCQRDLDSVRETLQVYCPVFVMVCDLERAPGFPEFLSFYPEGQRRRFLGQQFPLAPDLDASARLRMAEKGAHWIGNVLFPSLVYKNWGVDSPDGFETNEATARNIRLYAFLTQLRERQRRLARLLTRGVILQAQGPAMLGGCCFSATGRDLVREQGFANGMFRLLQENQNHVAWTDEALAIEADYGRWERLGYAGLIAFLIGVIVIGFLFWPR